MSEINQPKSDLNEVQLRDLIRTFFQWKSFSVQESVSIPGNSGNHEFDFLLSSGSESPQIGVLLKDWGRTCGVNVILQFEQVVKDARPNVHQGMLVANQFSSSARSLAEKAGILLLSRGELVSIFRNQRIEI